MRKYLRQSQRRRLTKKLFFCICSFFAILLVQEFFTTTSASRRLGLNSINGSASAYPVSVTMTTCNRLNLTLESLSSFFQYNSDVSIKSFKMVVDCFNSTFSETIARKYPKIELLEPMANTTSPSARVMENVQLLYHHILRDRAKYWVHLEDDWTFVENGFVSDALKIFNSLDDTSPIWQVMGREANAFNPKMNQTWGEMGWRTNPDNITYGVMNIMSGGGGYFGSFTLNDSVIRVGSLQRFGLNFSSFTHEAKFSLELGIKHNAQVAVLKKHRYYHTGGGQSTMEG